LPEVARGKGAVEEQLDTVRTKNGVLWGSQKQDRTEKTLLNPERKSRKVTGGRKGGYMEW